MDQTFGKGQKRLFWRNCRTFTPKWKFFWKIRLRWLHCVKNVQIQGFFWSESSHIQSKYGNTRTKKNYVFGHFSRGVSDPEDPLTSCKISKNSYEIVTYWPTDVLNWLFIIMKSYCKVIFKWRNNNNNNDRSSFTGPFTSEINYFQCTTNIVLIIRNFLVSRLSSNIPYSLPFRGTFLVLFTQSSTIR